MAPRRPDKYQLYEAAVQAAGQNVDILLQFYAEQFGKTARVLREDFCGTFSVACDWVTRGLKNQAVCLDLDPEPLRYGIEHHYARLHPHERNRVHPMERNVLSVTHPKADVEVAGNFSFFILKERKTLLQYFTSALASLNEQGLLVLEVVGGPGMTAEMIETKTCHARGLVGKFKYIWDQQSFDPLTREGRYAIHFKLADGTRMKDAFVYDWRLWTPPELKDALLEAGFDRTCVYWYHPRPRTKTGYAYVETVRGENDPSWLAYVVGIKGPKR